MQKAIDATISTWPDDNPQLIGSRCGDCAATTFPMQDLCPRCSGSSMSEHLLPRSGTLVAWTTQGFPPGAPYAGPTGDDHRRMVHRWVSQTLVTVGAAESVTVIAKTVADPPVVLKGLTPAEGKTAPDPP